ncbi:MAG: acylphosphatase [Lachnospiraceae bacterium]|nr:acylphosphatase [Lachnospiraceae bacterium]
MFIKYRDGYVINQVELLKLPEFETDRICRQKVTFSGRVQNVGFRLEVCQLATRLGLTGYCKNMENGDVLAELQGSENRIQYLITFMKSLKRIKIRNMVIKEMEVNEKESVFLPY